MSEKTIRVLIIEDNYGDVLLIKEMLAEIREKKFELEWKDEMKSGLEYLKSNSVDIVLLDLSLPDSSGIETFSKFHIAYPEVPVILLTGLADEELATTMVQAGAQDYLVKGAIDSTLISRAILYAIERSAFLKFSTLELKRRKIMEETLTRVNRALQMLSECNQVVVRSHTEDELYNNVCEILIKAGGFYCAWILLSDEIEENFEIFIDKEKINAVNTLIKDENLDSEIAADIISEYEFSSKMRNDIIKKSFKDELCLKDRRLKVQTIKEKIINLVEKFTM